MTRALSKVGGMVGGWHRWMVHKSRTETLACRLGAVVACYVEKQLTLVGRRIPFKGTFLLFVYKSLCSHR